MSFFITTISLIILIYISYIIKIPKVSIPLLGIYILYILIGFFNEEENEVNLSENQINFNSFDEQNTKINDDYFQNNIEPRPLIIPDIKSQNNDKPKKIKKPGTKLPIVKKKKNTNKPYITTLTMRDMQICKSVKNRTPVGTDTYFFSDVDSLFCYTRVQNTGGKQELTHLWYFEDQLIGTVRYNIKTSNIYRSWTRKTILPSQVGAWRVEVQDTAGVVIGSEFFYVTKQKKS